MDNLLTSLSGLIGLAYKAGKALPGEEPAAIAAGEHKARLILLAADAAGNTAEKAGRLGERGNCPVVQLPLTKAQLGGALGRSTCAVLALTDVGLASTLMKKLAAADPQAYSEVARKLEGKADKALRRKKEQRAKERSSRKPWVAPPKKEGS